MTEQPKWQPISTAPKDGTDILLFYPAGAFDSEYNDFEGRHMAVTAVMRWESHPNGYGHWKDYYSDTSPYDPATHWMPLPAPPTENE